MPDEQPRSIQTTGTSSEGDSHINDMSHILGDVEEYAAPDDQAADLTDSGDEQAEQPQTAVSDAPAETDRAAILAKEHGLDPANPRDKKLLDILLVQEKRLADKDGYIDNLKQVADLDLTTEFDRQLSQDQKDEKANAAPQQPNNGQQPYRPQDIGDREGWRTPRDASASLFKAYQEGNVDLAAEIQQAWFHRVIGEMMPQIGQGIEMRLQEFKKSDIGEVTQGFTEQKQERMRTAARSTAVQQLRAIPQVDQAWDAMFHEEPGAKPIEIDGAKYAPNAFNRIIGERPEILAIRVDRDGKGRFLAPEQQETATYLAQYRAVVREYLREQKGKQAEPQKAAALVKAGEQMAKRENGQERARQSLNAGGRQRNGGPPSSDDQWMESMAAKSHTTTGKSARTLFRG